MVLMLISSIWLIYVSNMHLIKAISYRMPMKIHIYTANPHKCYRSYDYNNMIISYIMYIVQELQTFP